MVSIWYSPKKWKLSRVFNILAKALNNYYFYFLLSTQYYVSFINR